MRIGASTANFYPQTVEQSLDTILQAGFSDVEIFFNATSELKPDFVRELKKRVDGAGAHVRAVHPHSSFMEPHFLFSLYERRADDMIEDYKRLFEAAALLSAPYLVLHGDRENGALSLQQSLERYERLYDVGAALGVRVAQENVVHFRGGTLPYLTALRKNLGDKAAFVLDTKQTVRCGHSIDDVLAAMGDKVVHVHVSDHTAERDCLPPGTGQFDFAYLFDRLRAQGFNGACMVELYRANFDTVQDLIRAKAYLENL